MQTKIISDIIDETNRNPTELSFQGYRDELRARTRNCLAFNTDKINVKNSLIKLGALIHDMIDKIDRDLKNDR